MLKMKLTMIDFLVIVQWIFSLMHFSFYKLVYFQDV